MLEEVSDMAHWPNKVFMERPWRQGYVPELATVPSATESCWKCGFGRELTDFRSWDFGIMVLEGSATYQHGCNVPIHQLSCGAGQMARAQLCIHFKKKITPELQNETSFAWFNLNGSLITSWLLFRVRLSVYKRDMVISIEHLKSCLKQFNQQWLCVRTWLHRTWAQRTQHHLTVKVLAKVWQDLSVFGFVLKPKLGACIHVCKDVKAHMIAGACWSPWSA